jgi:hypothetical protein
MKGLIGEVFPTLASLIRMSTHASIKGVAVDLFQLFKSSGKGMVQMKEGAMIQELLKSLFSLIFLVRSELLGRLRSCCLSKESI